MPETIVNMTVKNQWSGKQHLTKPEVTPKLSKDGRKLAVPRYTKLVHQSVMTPTKEMHGGSHYTWKILSQPTLYYSMMPFNET